LQDFGEECRMGDFENITGCSGEYLDIPRDERKETGEK
jgi:hypothetical protein